MKTLCTLLTIRDWLVGLSLRVNDYAVAMAEHTYYKNVRIIQQLQQVEQGYQNDNDRLREYLCQNGKMI